jgi:hypothetical protein
MSKQYQKTVFENVEAKLTKKGNQLFADELFNVIFTLKCEIYYSNSSI